MIDKETQEIDLDKMFWEEIWDANEEAIKKLQWLRLKLYQYAEWKGWIKKQEEKKSCSVEKEKYITAEEAEKANYGRCGPECG